MALKKIRKDAGSQTQTREFEKSIEVLSREMDAIDTFVLRHWASILWVGAALIVAVGAGMLIHSRMRLAAAEASAALCQADSIEKLESALAVHAAAPAAPCARLRLAALYFAKKRYDDAQRQYDMIISRGVRGEVDAIARVNSGYILEAKGDKKAAADAFLSASASPGLPVPFRLQADFNAGRLLLELGRKEDAVAKLKACVADKLAIPEAKGDGKAKDWHLWPEKAEMLLRRVN